MIELKRGARRLETSRCPLCKQSIEGDSSALRKHIGNTHAPRPEYVRGDIIWTDPPHEAVFMGKHYKRPAK